MYGSQNHRSNLLCGGVLVAKYYSLDTMSADMSILLASYLCLQCKRRTKRCSTSGSIISVLFRPLSMKFCSSATKGTRAMLPSELLSVAMRKLHRCKMRRLGTYINAHPTSGDVRDNLYCCVCDNSVLWSLQLRTNFSYMKPRDPGSTCLSRSCLHSQNSFVSLASSTPWHAEKDEIAKPVIYELLSFRKMWHLVLFNFPQSGKRFRYQYVTGTA